VAHDFEVERVEAIERIGLRNKPIPGEVHRP
jgi:hypothetical protein